MSLINKSIANEVASKVLQSKWDLVQKNESDFMDMLESEYLKTIPQAVKDFNEIHTNYINKTSTISPRGNGWGYRDFHYDKTMITNRNEYCFFPEPKVAEKLLKMINAWEKSKKDYNLLHQDLTIALCQMRTYKNVEENFPLAVQFLPQRQTKAVAINYTDIIKRVTT